MKAHTTWRKFSTIRKACWAEGFSTPCNGKRTREHVVSDSILRLTGALKHKFNGKEYALDETNYRIKNLCNAHNSRLSVYDSEALKYYSAVYFALENKAPHPSIEHQIDVGKVVIDGYKFEKWLAKTFFNSIIYDFGAYKHSNQFFDINPHSIVDKIYTDKNFTKPFGLYWLIPSRNKFSYMWPQYLIGKQFVNGIWKNIPTPKFYSLGIYGVEMLGLFNVTNQSDEWFCEKYFKQGISDINNEFHYRDLRIKLPRKDGGGMLEIEVNFD
ncbi:MAG: hypothetical protein GY928_09400 [Colwellia sp.]|nr:hypothetical protein [Colwellia sp.]